MNRIASLVRMDNAVGLDAAHMGRYFILSEVVYGKEDYSHLMMGMKVS